MNKTIIAAGKRKRAVARAKLLPGTGIVTINGINLNVFNPKLYRLRIQTPLILIGDAASEFNISVKANGGGISSMADACALAIGRALVKQNNKFEKILLDYDRQLLVADVRRKESAKPNRHGQARSKVQKSYR